MKTSQLTTFVLVFFIFLAKGQSYILPLDFVLKKASQKTGHSLVSIDYEVTFKNEKEQIKVFENWFIDGDRNLKVIATGADKYQNNIRLSTLFNAKNKIQVAGKVRNTYPISNEFFQKIPFTREKDDLIEFLKTNKIVTSTKLSRVDGRVCIAVGESSTDSNVYPMIWFDQDDFLIRKIRLPNDVEVLFSDYFKVTEDFWLAKRQVVNWGKNTATVVLKGYATKLNNKTQHFAIQNFDQPTEVSFAESTPLTQAVEEFYKRFR